jgi:alpha-ketoglutaric semialdehyde dehydrogenase
MLHQGIAENYHKRLKHALAQKGISVEGQSSDEGGSGQGRPLVASVPAQEFISNPALAEEVFGPFSLIVRCKNMDEFHSVINRIQGQLTATVIANEDELTKHKNLINILVEKAGRVIMNGVPTGVEVCPAMQHGGPFPSTTDSRFTSVGTDAIKRFVRPVAFQNFSDSLLPDELKEANPLGLWRLRDGKWGRV